MFYILYIVFFISALLYGSLYIGAITPRQLITVLMFIYLLSNRKVFFDKYMKLYLVFIVFYLLSNFISGYIAESIKFVFAFFFVGYVGYCATKCLLQKRKGFEVFINTIIIIGCINSIVTIFQLLHIDAINSFVDVLHLNEGYDSMIAKHSNYSSTGNNEFIFAMPGLFQDPVTNGYFSSVAAICSMFLLYKRFRLVSFLPWLLLTFGCFATQQRTSLVTAIICSAVAFYYIIKYQKKASSGSIITLTLILLCIIIFLSTHSFNIETRFDDLLNMDSRNSIFELSISFISNNFFFGGINTFFAKYGIYPHNLIFNALIVGGLFGAIPIFIILIKQIKASFSIMSQAKNSLLLVFPILCIFSMLGASLMHNQSIVYGDFLYWCFASFIICSENRLIR